jgi:predicted Rossmann-fold nucleotide-binding protein
VLSWAQLGLHAKPIGLLDAQGYWRDLVAWIDGAVASGFVPARHRDLVAVERDLDALLERFDAWSAPPAR